MASSKTSIDDSGAFVEAFTLEPTAEGPLAGLRFAVKDLIDVAGHNTGCGNPTWLKTHPPAAVHAVCVAQILSTGARCIGKTITDEVAFSLIGKNHFYGTPLNPRAPDRVPGGSSSGSASAVACGLADFALGTDTGGSVRVPASNCGLFGLRPSHGFVSVAGVMPFAPTFDTVGVLAADIGVLARTASILLATPPAEDDPAPKAVHILTDAFALVDAEVRAALAPALDRLRRLFGATVRETSLAEICPSGSGSIFPIWHETYCSAQWSEIASSLGAWIADARPEFGPTTAASMELVKNFDRRRIGAAWRQRELLAAHLGRFLGPRDLLCIPTVPAPAPLKEGNHARTGDYYIRALSLTSLAGIGRLPQVSLPVGEVSGAPVGLSLLAAHCEDMFLLEAAQALSRAS